MIRWFRNVSESLREISSALGGLLESVHALSMPGPTDQDLAGRVAALERELERRHAEAEGLLLKARGKHDAARAAEERARRLASRGPEESDDGGELDEDTIRRAYAEAGVSLADGDGSEEEGLPAVPGGMARRQASKRSAYDAKWGR